MNFCYWRFDILQLDETFVSVDWQWLTFYRRRPCLRVQPKDYDEDLFSSSEDDDDFDPDKGEGGEKALPSVLPLPGFLVSALMDAFDGRRHPVSRGNRRD
jgi:hypothetical protein